MGVDNSEATPTNNPRGGVRGVDDGEQGQQEAGSHRMSGNSLSNGDLGPSSSGNPSQEPQGLNSDDTDAHSSGNDSAEREVEGHMGHEASTCSSRNGKDSAMETTESKSSNSHSPSPPSSSVAYSLLSGSSEQDHPSTSGCSSDQSARRKTQKELLKALKELKIRVPADHRGKGRSSTLASLQYALNCVKQVRANQEYYHQWSVEETQGCSLDLSAFTIEELDDITSEYILHNTDTFSVAVSFLSGKVVYSSPQASSLLRCKPERLQGAVFSELLAPQDVSTFYSSTAPSRLPPWASCSGSASAPAECTQEKSMFCRITGGRECEGEVRYYPFRLYPYQMTLRDSDISQPQPCCLLIAERVHSGYEAPRIPADKRIFTTSHSPSCVFQEIDERAVPLLGYLPQDLVGTPVLLYLHPDDRPLMVAIHKKILQFAGQPFEHSPLRMCARSGEYLTLDTSWSSFVNPWSRKVAFIVGRHKVRTSPLNEDVFTPAQRAEARSMSPEIPQLSEQIHRVLVQPVHSGGSQGYSSLGSNRSQEQPQSACSSSDTSAAKDISQSHKLKTFQQICKDVHKVKTNGQQVFIESRNRPPLRKHTGAGSLVTPKPREAERFAKAALEPSKALPSVLLPRKDSTSSYSYQQINCLDSIVRYLESCNVPNTVKRKCCSSSCTTSSTSDDDKGEPPGAVSDKEMGVGMGEGTKHPLTPLALHCKAESVASVTSQCSFSSTIVHVGDKKPPESDIVMMEEAPVIPSAAPSTPASARPANAPIKVTPPAAALPSLAVLEPEARRGAGSGAGHVGLTKEVLSAHTQQEEQAFLCRFQDLSQLRVLDHEPGPRSGPSPLQTQATTPFNKEGPSKRDHAPRGSSGRRRGRGGKRLKHQQDGSYQSNPSGGRSTKLASRRAAQGPSLPVLPDMQHMCVGPQTSSSSWPTSVGSQASYSPTVPAYPPGVLPLFSFYPPPISQQLVANPGMEATMQVGYPGLQMGTHFPHPASQLPLHGAPPVMTFVLPNYMFPQLNQAVPQLNPAMAQLNPAMAQLNPAMAQLNPAMAQLNPAMPQLNPALAQLNPALAQLNPALAQLNPAMAQLNPAMGRLNPAMAQMNPAYAQLNQGLPQLNQIIPQISQVMPQLNQLMPQLNQAMSLPQLNPALAQFNPSMTPVIAGLPHMSPPPLSSSGTHQLNPAVSSIPPNVYNPNCVFSLNMPPGLTLPRLASRSSTPQSLGHPPVEQARVDSPLFQSRCSSPLNLLQLEELPSNRLEVTPGGAQQTPPPVADPAHDWSGGAALEPVSVNRSCLKGEAQEKDEEANDDVMSTSSDLLDLLLQEDSLSGTGSSGSGSGSSGSGSGSGSNGCSTSGSGTRSSNTSKYFGSVDSSENDHSHKQPQGGTGEEQFMKYALQDPIWLLMANTDDKVMMTYQMPVRDRDTVLKEDRAVLKAAQKQQPRFSDEQKKELSQVHPWIRTGRLPRAINISACTGCGCTPPGSVPRPFDMDLHDTDLTGVLQLPKRTLSAISSAPCRLQTAMEKEGDHQGEAEGNTAAATNNHNMSEDHDMSEEFQVTSSEAVKVDW